MPKGTVCSFVFPCQFFVLGKTVPLRLDRAATHHTPLSHSTTASEAPVAPLPLPPSGHLSKCLLSPPFPSALPPSSFQSSLKVPSQHTACCYAPLIPLHPFPSPPPPHPSCHLSNCLLSTLLAALQGYTPHVVVSKTLITWYDERIHDSDLGRQLHIEHMQSAGLGFVVHPNAFLVKQAVQGQLLQPPSEATQQADVSPISLFL